MRVFSYIPLGLLLFAASVSAQQPVVGMVDTPSVKVLTGLTVPEFEAEMQQMTASLGVSCGFCHVRGNFASENNPHKATARRKGESPYVARASSAYVSDGRAWKLAFHQQTPLV